MNITIREANPADARTIAWAVAEAVGLNTAKNYGGEDFIATLTEIAEKDNTQYSYRNALTAIADGVIAGVIVAYDGGRLAELRDNTLALIHKYNPTLTVTDDETEAGEYYFDTISVLPEYRGHGIGTTLLTAMRDKAFAAGHQRVGLLVDYENPSAERLYRNLGFECVGTRLFFGHRMKHMQQNKK